MQCCAILQITAELSKHLGRGGAAQASSHSLPLSQEAKPHQYGWATAVESAPQLLAAGSSPTALEAVTRSSVSLFPPSAVTASVPLPKKAVKKKKAGVKAESSNASLAACIESLNGARPHGPSSRPQSASFSSSLPASFSAAGLPAEATAFSAAGLTASIPLPAFGSSSVRVARGPGMAGGIKHSALSLGSLNSFAPDLPASTSGVTTAPGAVNAALELSLLLTTLQSLANLPEEEGQLHNTIASGSRQAQAQLRDWLAQLQQHAALAASEPVSTLRTTCLPFFFMWYCLVADCVRLCQHHQRVTVTTVLHQPHAAASQHTMSVACSAWHSCFLACTPRWTE